MVTHANKFSVRQQETVFLHCVTLSASHTRVFPSSYKLKILLLHSFEQMQMIMCDLSANWNNSYRELEQRILSMEQKLDELNRCFHQTSELLSQVLRHRNTEIR